MFRFNVQLCLMAKNLKPVLPYLDREYDDLLTEVGEEEDDCIAVEAHCHVYDALLKFLS